jgi:hypothetical protein
MARGWESKSVESQIESAESAKKHIAQQEISMIEMGLIREREGLLLSRTRILRDLEDSNNPRYRQILNKALADLDTKLSRFNLRKAAHV